MNEYHMFNDYESFYHKVENSPAFSKYCETVYGADFSQDGFADLKQIMDLLTSLRLTSGSKILDIGCGNGKFCEYVHVRTEADVFGFDYSPTAITSAKKRLAEQAEHFEVATIDGQDYPEMSFDAIVSIDTLYFTDDLETLVGKIIHWLKPGGVFAAYYMDDNRGQDETQLAQVLRTYKMKYKAVDYSESHFYLMRRKHDTVLAMRDALERDGLVEHIKRMLVESFDENVTIESIKNKHCGLRYLYTVCKPEKLINVRNSLYVEPEQEKTEGSRNEPI